MPSSLPILFFAKSIYSRGGFYLLHNGNYKTCDFLFLWALKVLKFLRILEIREKEAELHLLARSHVLKKLVFLRFFLLSRYLFPFPYITKSCFRAAFCIFSVANHRRHIRHAPGLPVKKGIKSSFSYLYTSILFCRKA